jgi:glutaryl-CoA dehydrogenase
MGSRADYYAVEELFDDETRLIQESVRHFVDQHVRPRVGSWWLAGEFPESLVKGLADLGAFGARLPAEYGGAGLSPLGYGVLMQELERGDSGIRSFASVQSALAMGAVFRFGSDEQRRTWLPPMARGEVLGCFALTEPEAGSDPAAMRTRARRTPEGGWVIDGVKRWITNGTLAQVAVVWAKDEEGRVRGFLVPTDTPGFRAKAITTKASMRLSDTAELTLTGVTIPDALRLPDAEGLGAALQCLTDARYGIAWGAVGAAEACLEEAMAFAGTRIAFGRPIAATQLVQERLVDMTSRVAEMKLVAWRLATLSAAGRLRYQQVSLAKRDNVRRALEVARAARELLGASGITVEYQAMRHAANLETVDTYEGTYEVHTLIVGRDLTGHDAF